VKHAYPPYLETYRDTNTRYLVRTPAPGMTRRKDIPRQAPESVCPKVCPPKRIADTLSATRCNIAGGRDPAPLLVLR